MFLELAIRYTFLIRPPHCCKPESMLYYILLNAWKGQFLPYQNIFFMLNMLQQNIYEMH